MNERALTTEQAERVYRVLCEYGGAKDSPGEIQSFIAYITDPNCHQLEWRFQGHFGFGGKLYHQGGRLYAGYYPEDVTPARELLLERLNEELDTQYRAWLKTNGPAGE
jgi:hypothetical protein